MVDTSGMVLSVLVLVLVIIEESCSLSIPSPTAIVRVPSFHKRPQHFKSIPCFCTRMNSVPRQILPLIFIYMYR